nr:hypothetical protein [Tanacetum cinerariifolium]
YGGILAVARTFSPRLVSLNSRPESPRYFASFGFFTGVGPVGEVVGAGEAVDGTAHAGVKGSEIEHDPQAVIQPLQVSVARDAGVVVEHGVAQVARPVRHVVRHGHADALGAALGIEAVAVGIVVHHEGVAGELGLIPGHGAFVDGVVFPPAEAGAATGARWWGPCRYRPCRWTATPSRTPANCRRSRIASTCPGKAATRSCRPTWGLAGPRSRLFGWCPNR